LAAAAFVLIHRVRLDVDLLSESLLAEARAVPQYRDRFPEVLVPERHGGMVRASSDDRNCNKYVTGPAKILGIRQIVHKVQRSNASTESSWMKFVDTGHEIPGSWKIILPENIPYRSEGSDVPREWVRNPFFET